MSDDNTRRHWHGSPGDRYEHHNVWMNGGAKGPSIRAPWAMPVGSETATRRVGDICLLRFDFLFYYFLVPITFHTLTSEAFPSIILSTTQTLYPKAPIALLTVPS